MRKFNMKKARVLYRKGIHNFEPRTPYQTSGMFRKFTTDEFENMRDPSRTRQFNNVGYKKGINLGGNSDMSRYNVNEDYITTSSTSSGDNLKRLNEMYKSNNLQIPTLSPADKKNIMDYMYKSDYGAWMKKKDDDLINYYFDKQKKNGGYMTAQLGKQFYPEYEEERVIKNQRDQLTNQKINDMLNERLGDYYKADDQFEINQNINSMLNRELLDSYKTPPKLKQTMEEEMQDYLNPEVLKNYMDRQGKQDADFYDSFYQAPHKNYENPFFKYPRKKAQFSEPIVPSDNTSSKMDPFKINQTEQPEPYINNDMYNRGYNIKYDMQGKPIEPTTPFENDPFNPNWIEYNQALKDYYKTLENDPNNYSHMKKGLRPKMRKPSRISNQESGYIPLSEDELRYLSHKMTSNPVSNLSNFISPGSWDHVPAYFSSSNKLLTERERDQLNSYMKNRSLGSRVYDLIPFVGPSLPENS